MAIGERPGEAILAVRRPGKRVLSILADYLVGRRIPDINSGFRALYRKDGLAYLPLLPNGFSLTTTITLAMLRDGREVSYVPINVQPRSGGKSTVRYAQDGTKALLLMLRVIMLFNPLKIFAPISAGLLLVGGSYSIYTLVSETNISDSSILLVITGLLFLFMGLIADQIASLRRGG
jgi:hypothetical protein